MNPWQRDVQEFQRAIGQPSSPAEVKLRTPMLRACLIGEEAVETVMAILGPTQGYLLMQDLLAKAAQKMAKAEDQPSLSETIDGLCDTIVVCLGTAEDIGVDLDPFFREVMDANMRKLDGPVDPATGKKGKPPGWVGPDIEGLLAKLVYEKESVA